MHIDCECGATIVDQSDALAHKAYVIPDQEWFGVLEAIDGAIERSEDKEAAAMGVHGLLTRVLQMAWQCRACGRLYVDDQNNDAWIFVPGSDDVPCEIFRSRP